MISRSSIRITSHTRTIIGSLRRYRPFLIRFLAPTIAATRGLSTTTSYRTTSTPSPTPTPLLPEFSLASKVILVSGAARGLGLIQAEALLEAGATVYALDRLPSPSADFERIQKRAEEELGTKIEYRQIDVRDVEGLNGVVAGIAEEHGHVDGLIAAAGIQQERSALEYSAEDAK
jgi:hypothetical protein